MSSSIRNSALYLSQIVISGALTLLLMPIISMHLSPTDFGLFVLAQVYSSVVVGIANLGMLTAYDRNFFIYEKSKDDSASLIYAAIMFVTFNLLVLLFLVYSFEEKIYSLLFNVSVPKDLLVITLLGVSAASISQYYLFFLKNSSLAKGYITHTILHSLIYFILVFILIKQFNLGPMSLAYAWAVSNSIILMSLALFIGKLLPTGFNITMLKKMLKEMLKISLPLTPRVFFGYLNTQFDKVFLGLIGSEGLVAIYHMGQTLALTIFQFMTGLGRVFQPEIYRKLFSNKYDSNSYEITYYLFPFHYFSIFVSIVIVVFSDELVSILLSNEYKDATPVIVILSTYYLLMFFGKVTGAQLIYAKKTHIITVLMLIGIVVNVGLNIPFIINWGLVGAAWATTVSGVIMTVVSYFVAQKQVMIRWNWGVLSIMYGVFFTANIFALADYYFIFTFYVSLSVSIFLIFIFIALGCNSGVLSKIKIKEIMHSN